jgi:hypothetical protein
MVWLEMVTVCTGIGCGVGGAGSPEHATIRKQAARPAQRRFIGRGLSFADFIALANV